MGNPDAGTEQTQHVDPRKADIIFKLKFIEAGMTQDWDHLASVLSIYAERLISSILKLPQGPKLFTRAMSAVDWDRQESRRIDDIVATALESLKKEMSKETKKTKRSS
jgi:hypothetical protein